MKFGEIMKKILLVEDEIVVGEDIEKTLKSHGYEVVANVISGEEALEKAEKFLPDLAIMDISIEGNLSGLETAKYLHRKFDIPVIFLTAYADKQTLEHAKQAEPYGYIIKPFEERELIATIEMAFHKSDLAKKLKTSEEYARNIINSSMDMIVTFDNNLKIVEFNKMAEKTFGYEKAEILGNNIKKLFSDEREFYSIYNNTFQKGNFNFEALNKRKSGEVFQSVISSSLMRSEHGKIEGYLLILREVTELKQYEKMLRELRKAVETIRLGVTITDINGKIIYTNPADAEMHGYKVEELIGKDVRIFAPAGKKNFSSMEQIKRWKGMVRESVNVKKDGTEFPVWLISSVVKDYKGNPTSIVTTCEDISERKEMEKQLLRSERLAGIGELAAGIAHEIRNPLGNISSSAQFCLSKYDLQKEVKQYLEIILRNSQNANKIIKELLSFANPRDISLAPVQVNDIIENVIRLVRGRINEKQINIEKKLSPNLPWIPLDEKLIEQAFLNFILNAIDALDNAGNISITTKKNNKNEIEIIFIDDGEGIPEENLKKIFDPFFTTKHNGVGLGLSLVHQIILAHKGKIFIDSKVNKGTKITINLPILNEK